MISNGKKKKIGVLSVAVATFVITASLLLLLAPQQHITSSGFVLGEPVPFEKSYNRELSNPSKFVRYANPNEKIDVTIGLKWRNEAQLDDMLKNMNDPNSPMYQHFYTWGEFKEHYSPPNEIYNALLSWLKENGLHIKSTTPLRNAVTIHDTMGNIGRAFGVKFGVYRGDGISLKKYYYAPISPPEIPANLAPYIIGIDGINSARVFYLNFWTDTNTADSSSQALYGSSAPSYVRGLTGADLEYIYGVTKLFNNSASGAESSQHIFPTHVRVATVLWEGTNSTGYQFAPFDPSNVLTYYQDVTPDWIQQELQSEIGEKTSEIGWYSPNPQAAPPSGDVDGNVNVENELDLEMVGTLAPGVNVTLVYSNGSYYSNGFQSTSVPGEDDFPDQEYNYILNTLAAMTDRPLVAVSNSWGAVGNYSMNSANSVTMSDVKALNALGVSVLASSGDAGNNTPSWPAEAAFDNYGFLAIGGTTLVPNGVDNSDTLPSDVPLKAENLDKSNPRFAEYVWYDIMQSLFGTQTSGTECGVTSAYPEPSWQNETIGTGWGGRVTADISAIGNRTIILTSVQSLFGLQSNVWYAQGGGIAGTSVSSPVMAGIFADMAEYYGREYGVRGFGFFAPTIYHLGYDFYHNGMYSDSPPFTDITEVYPSSYPAPPAVGYDMPTGWGTINAWNFIHDIGFRITSEEAKLVVNPGSSGVFHLKVWFPYGWNTTVGHFEVYGLPSGATGSFDKEYVDAPGWEDNYTASSNLQLTIATASSTATGIYTIYVVARTYNASTGQYGNLTYNLTLTLQVGENVPEFQSTGLSVIVAGMIIGIAAIYRRRERLLD